MTPPDESTQASDQAAPDAPAAPAGDVAATGEAPPAAAGAQAPDGSSDATDAPAMPSSSEPATPAAPAPSFTVGQLVLVDKPRPGVSPPPVFGAIVVGLSDAAATIVELGPLRAAMLDELRPVPPGG